MSFGSKYRIWQPIRFLLATSFLVLLGQQTSAQAPDKVAFQILPVDAPVSYMEMSDDGTVLILCHQSENKISLFDVRNNKVVSTVETATPRNAMWRNGTLIVGSRIASTITYFQFAGGEWKPKREFKIPKFGLVHMSGGYGRSFRNELIVTCHGDGRTASYQNSMIFVLNSRGQFLPASKSALASVSYDGQTVLKQESFNLSPSGGISGFRYRDFVRNPDQAPKIVSGGESSTPYVYQVAKGGYLIGRNMVFGGIPLTKIDKDVGGTIAPDRSQSIIYGIGADTFSAHKLNTTLDVISSVPIEFPIGFSAGRGSRDDKEIFYSRAHQRDYVLDHPEACTIEGETFVFLRPKDGGQVLYARFGAFAKPKAAKPAKAIKIIKGAAVAAMDVPADDPVVARTVEREFVSRDGRFKVLAELVSVDGEQVKLKRVDNGKLVTLSINLLSEADKQFITMQLDQESADGEEDVVTRTMSLEDFESNAKGDDAMKTKVVETDISLEERRNKIEVRPVQGNVYSLAPFCQIDQLPGFRWQLDSEDPPSFSAASPDGLETLLVNIESKVTKQIEKRKLANKVFDTLVQRIKTTGFVDIKGTKIGPKKKIRDGIQLKLSALHPPTGDRAHCVIRIKYDDPKHSFVFMAIAQTPDRAAELVKFSDTFRQWPE